MNVDYIAENLAAKLDALTRNPRRTLRVVAITTGALGISLSLYLMDRRDSTLGEVFGAFFEF